MITKLLLPLLTLSSLYAQGISDENLNSIYTEATAFVIVIAFMSLVSIYYSQKHAKAYEEENPLQERKAAIQKEKEEELKNQFVMRTLDKNGNKIDRLLELQEMLKEGLINEEEFQVLKEKINIIP
jgi:acetyl-CoA carboxylase carboxyltransferase component